MAPDDCMRVWPGAVLDYPASGVQLGPARRENRVEIGTILTAALGGWTMKW
ncbi:hypothetical protein ABW19_dt0203585 [Dactylella cylindrospora]|nr:hypothetical protein ABW19_dt0203585 [Dactylella cylindrospora]